MSSRTIYLAVLVVAGMEYKASHQLGGRGRGKYREVSIGLQRLGLEFNVLNKRGWLYLNNVIIASHQNLLA